MTAETYNPALQVKSIRFNSGRFNNITKINCDPIVQQMLKVNEKIQVNKSVIILSHLYTTFYFLDLTGLHSLNSTIRELNSVLYTS